MSRVNDFSDPSSIFFRALSTGGDGTGDFNAIEDYSNSPTEFSVTPLKGEKLYASRFSVNMVFPGAPPPLWDGYGPIAGGLTNGVSIEVSSSASNVEFPAIVLMMNTNWTFLPTQRLNWGNGVTQLVCTLDLTTSGGYAILDGDVDYFKVKLNDDFSPFLRQVFILQGFKLPEILP